MAHRGFDEQMEALDALRGKALEPADLQTIKSGLKAKSNYLVAKAAKLAEENGRTELIPDLVAAFERFFQHAEKSDPQCWAKNALSSALSKLGCRDKDVFLPGLHFHQMEPTWGGKSDSAGTLRANCAHALVGCEGLVAQDLVLLLVDLLADDDKAVRVETVRAMSQLSDFAVPVLRLRALIPGEDPEVLSACFHALLSIDLRDSLAFVSRFLSGPAESAAEAAFALAETHSEPALQPLLERHQRGASAEGVDADVLLQAIAMTRLPRAVEYLAGLIESESREAVKAIEALAEFAASAEISERLNTAVDATGSPRLQRALADARDRVEHGLRR